jgi:hypothetical protein
MKRIILILIAGLILQVQPGMAQDNRDYKTENMAFMKRHHSRLRSDINSMVLSKLPTSQRELREREIVLRTKRENLVAITNGIARLESMPSMDWRLRTLDEVKSWREVGVRPTRPTNYTSKSLNSGGFDPGSLADLDLRPPITRYNNLNSQEDLLSLLQAGIACNCGNELRDLFKSYESRRQTGLLSADAYFDSKKYPKMSGFLKALGMTAEQVNSNPNRTKNSNDLSNLFKDPSLQGKTGACVAFAFLSDLETHPGVPVLSKGYAYGVMAERSQRLENIMTDPQNERLTDKEFEKLIERESAKLSPAEDNLSKTVRDRNSSLTPDELNVLGVLPNIGEWVVKNTGIPLEENFKFPNIFPESLSKVPGPRFSATEVATVEFPAGTANFQLVKAMIDAGKPPIAVITDDGRLTEENWYVPKTELYNHAVNVVGYGSGVSPFSNQRETYLIVRDSKGVKPIHYRVNASDFLSKTVGFAKTLGAKQL